jgi:hypothetical protein
VLATRGNRIIATKEKYLSLKNRTGYRIDRMNKLIRTALIGIVCMLGFVQGSGAQGISGQREYSGFFDSYYYRGPLSFTLGGGATFYQGDMGKGFYSTRPGVAISLGANYKVWPRVLFGAEFQYLTLAGHSGDTLDISMGSVNWGLNVYGRFYFVDDIIRKASDRRTNKKVKPYLTAGVGFIRYNSTLTPVPLAARGFAPVFPVGLGIEFKLSPRVQIIPEFTHTFALTDRLDVVPQNNTGIEGYGMASLKVQYSPFAPKKKRKLKTPPAPPNENREEHQEWRIKKKEQPVEDYENTLPDENETQDEFNEEGNSEEEGPKYDEDGYLIE